MAQRFIGVRHRRKQTKAGEARPTQVYLLDPSQKKPLVLNLENEDAELDFIRHRLPVEWRKIDQKSEMDLKEVRRLRGQSSREELRELMSEAEFELWAKKKQSQPDRSHHLKWRKLKKGQDHTNFAKELIRQDEKDSYFLAVKVPSAYEGMRDGDLVGMTLGGSGDYFAFAASNVGERISAEVFRLPPSALKKIREDHGIFEDKKTSLSEEIEEDGDDDDSDLDDDLEDEDPGEGVAKASKKANDPKDQDARLIAEELQAHETTNDRRGPFYIITADDRDMIAMRVALRDRIEVMKECVKAEQRLQQYVIGRIFFGPEGDYPQGSIEQEMKDRKSNDVICQALRQEEADRLALLGKRLRKIPFFPVLNSVKGVADAIASRLIAAIGDINRFPSAEKEECMTAELEAKLRVRDNLMQEGRFQEGLILIKDLITSETSEYQKLQMVRDRVRESGDEERAKKLEQALYLWHRVHTKIYQRSRNKGMNRLKAFCGVHVLNGGRHGDRSVEIQFPKRRHGEEANWHPDARQAMFLFADQCKRSKTSEWGIKYREYKAKLKEKYPEPIMVQSCDIKGKPKLNKDGSPKMVKRYTNGHLDKMALRWVQTKFIEWVWREWWRLENAHHADPTPPTPRPLATV